MVSTVLETFFASNNGLLCSLIENRYYFSNHGAILSFFCLMIVKTESFGAYFGASIRGLWACCFMPSRPWKPRLWFSRSLSCFWYDISLRLLCCNTPSNHSIQNFWCISQMASNLSTNPPPRCRTASQSVVSLSRTKLGTPNPLSDKIPVRSNFGSIICILLQ